MNFIMMKIKLKDYYDFHFNFHKIETLTLLNSITFEKCFVFSKSNDLFVFWLYRLIRNKWRKFCKIDSLHCAEVTYKNNTDKIDDFLNKISK